MIGQNTLQLLRCLHKVNSVQETCAKCIGVHILEFEILQTTWKNKTKNIKMLDLLMKNSKLRVWSSLFQIFHVIWKISFNMWTAKHLEQASCTELTLKTNSVQIQGSINLKNQILAFFGNKMLQKILKCRKSFCSKSRSTYENYHTHKKGLKFALFLEQGHHHYCHRSKIKKLYFGQCKQYLQLTVEIFAVQQ